MLGAATMATGIVSAALAQAGATTPARLLLAAAVAIWTAMAASLLVARELAPAGPESLTAVAATAVVGARLVAAGASGLAWALLVVAFSLLALLLPRAIAALRPRARGSVFLLTVACDSVAVLLASLSSATGQAWAVIAAVPFGLLALLLYPSALRRFDLRQLREGAGDEWVSGGALAITALTWALIARAARDFGAAGLGTAAEVLAAAAAIGAAAWLPVLVGSELRRPRVQWDPRRWSTVFPLGMYSVAAHQVGSVAGLPFLVTFADVWTWVAVAAWLAAALAAAWSWIRAPRRR